jgi:hypothetical protein
MYDVLREDRTNAMSYIGSGSSLPIEVVDITTGTVETYKISLFDSAPMPINSSLDEGSDLSTLIFGIT